jgi:general secretion pathway protein D
MIQADAATNSLIITAPEPLYRNIRAIIEKLDVRQAQVVIESLIVEVTADKAAEFGIQWQALGGLREGSSGTSVIGGTNFGGAGTNIIGAAADLTSLGGGLNIGVIRGTVEIAGQTITNLGFLARALETSANANILSQPNIQTLDNEEAKFLVGQNVPFVTGSFASTGAGQTNTGVVNPFQTFERRDVGLQLRVKPQISEGGSVRLAIYLEVSSVQPGTSAGGLVTNKRSFESNVNVEDGNFVVLSGLIEDRTNNSESRVPLLGSLPLIGGLFRYENRDRRKTNTMVFLRPKVVRDEVVSSAISADRYEYMRTQTQQAQKPDNWVLRGYQGNELPPYPSVAPHSPAPAPQEVPPPMQRDAPVGARARDAAPVEAPAAPGSAVPPAAPTGDVATSAPVTLPGTAQPAPSPQAPLPAAPVSGSFAASASTPPPAGTLQLIQVSAVNDVARGRELQRQLREAGFDAYWERVRVPGRKDDVVRVRVSVDRATQDVAETMDRLRKRGLDPVLVTP